VTAGELVVVLAAILLSLGFTALVVTLMRVLDTLRDLRNEVADLRSETRPLLAELIETTDEARHTVDEARTDLERFDRVLGSAEAIGEAVSGRVARTAFSSPAIKAAGFARGTSRAVARLRGQPKVRTVDPGPSPEVLDLGIPRSDTRGTRRRRRG
jgi:ABC-type transporter Mla subunit MlaD